MSITCIKCVLIYLLPILVSLSACKTGWFGPVCQYQCHCINNSCVNSGVCQNARCSSGWFGPACQYQDLLSLDVTTTTPSNTTVLKDGDDNTCLTVSTTNVTVNFNSNVTIAWMRFNVKRPELINNLTLMFNGFQNVWLGCKKNALIDQRTVDVFCESSLSTRQIILIGTGVSSLCSLYFSGGRNVALKQSAMQSSTYNEESSALATNALDGNVDGRFTAGSCTHIGINDPSPNWNLTFSKMQRIHRYVIYNRDSFQDRLVGFILSSIGTNNTSVFDYTFETPSRSVYTVTLDPQNVSSVKIYSGSTGKILTLCEVEIYGETPCDFNKYGLECNTSCNCENKTETCHVATGGCPSGCAAGYYGEDCQTQCPLLKWGVGCLSNCSVHCVNGTCNIANGFCDLGCEIGFAKNLCKEECPNSTWGQDCSKTCGEHCVNSSCSNVNGVCTFGCNYGYMGENCEQQCPVFKWGNRCNSDCSLNCLNKTCDNTNGTCHNGCNAGYMGAKCSDSCSPLIWGENCANPCSDHCVNKTCDRFNGSCDAGCGSGYIGDMCVEVQRRFTQGQGETSSDDYELGVGLGVGFALLVAVGVGIAVVVIIHRRSRKGVPQEDFFKNATVIIKHTKTNTSVEDKKNNITGGDSDNNDDYRMTSEKEDCADTGYYLTPRQAREMNGSSQHTNYSSEDQDYTL